MNYFNLSIDEAEKCAERCYVVIPRLRKKTQVNQITPAEFKEKWDLTYQQLAFILGCGVTSIKRWVAGQNSNEQANSYLLYLDRDWTDKIINLYQLAGKFPVMELLENQLKESYPTPANALFSEVIIWQAAAQEYPEINVKLKEWEKNKEKSSLSWV